MADAAKPTKRVSADVQAERISVGDFLVDEWLPSRLPPALEESTRRSYDQKIRLHVIPCIGSIPLQHLSPVDLNQLYRHLSKLADGDPIRTAAARPR